MSRMRWETHPDPTEEEYEIAKKIREAAFAPRPCEICREFKPDWEGCCLVPAPTPEADQVIEAFERKRA